MREAPSQDSGVEALPLTTSEASGDTQTQALSHAGHFGPRGVQTPDDSMPVEKRHLRQRSLDLWLCQNVPSAVFPPTWSWGPQVPDLSLRTGILVQLL